MYEPRQVEEIDSTEENIGILRTQISKLQDEIDAMKVNDSSTKEISFEEAVKILETENMSLKEFVECEKKRKEELLNELSALSKYVEEEENMISTIDDYMKNEGAFQTEVVLDEETVSYFQLETLHRKMCTVIKKFAHDYDDTEQTHLASSSKKSESVYMNTRSHSKNQKSLLDLLKQLIPELRTENGIVENNGYLKIDETVDEKHIEFLLSAKIIERCKDNPDMVKLVE